MVLSKSPFALEAPRHMSIQTDNGDSDIVDGNFPMRVVACPHCKDDSVYHPSNASRPFCSPKCRALDLGAWANEDFRVAQNRPPEDIDFEDS